MVFSLGAELAGVGLSITSKDLSPPSVCVPGGQLEENDW